MTTTLCYLDDPARAFSEVTRVLRPGGAFVVGFVDRDGPLGRRYEARRDTNDFYAPARFYTAREVRALIKNAGFEEIQSRQTLFSDPESMTEPDPVREGTGEGGFVGLRGVTPV